MSSISARHALTDQEMEFCKIYAGFGYTSHTDAYRRSFFPPRKNNDGYLQAHPDLPSPKEANRLAKLLLDKPHIQAFLEELKAPAGDRARDVLTEQAHFGSDQIARQAAVKILEDEDRLGFRDAVEQWTTLMCAIGTEVVVPLPGGGEVAFPLREMFPRFEDPLPPADALLKTEKALAAYRKKLEADDAGV